MAVVMMSRPDNLGALPFSDYADPDPDALPFDDAAVRDECAHVVEDGDLPGYPYRCLVCGEHLGSASLARPRRERLVGPWRHVCRVMSPHEDRGIRMTLDTSPCRYCGVGR